MKTELELLLIQRYSSTNTSLQAELHLHIEVATKIAAVPLLLQLLDSTR